MFVWAVRMTMEVITVSSAQVMLFIIRQLEGVLAVCATEMAFKMQRISAIRLVFRFNFEKNLKLADYSLA